MLSTFSRESEEYCMSLRPFFTSAQLKILALSAMLLDHIGVVLFPEQLWMRCAGRIAFPLFAFELVQGYIHTRDLRRYALRLLLLAAVSEIPFNLAIGASFFYPWRQNTVWTLLCGLVACFCADALAGENKLSLRLAYLLGLIAALLLSELMMTDYGTGGVMFILLFLLTKNGGAVGAVAQLVGMLALCLLLLGGRTIVVGAFELEVEYFALLSLPFIWLYNGRRGAHGRALQYAAYAFYPAHLLILWIIPAVRSAVFSL